VATLEDIWWREGESERSLALLAALSFAEGLFAAAAAGRRALFRSGLWPSARAPVPVISLGNLAVGGAGKTPATLCVGQRLLARGRRPAILSRGYRASLRNPRVVSDGRSLLLSANEAGDEPFMLARRLPQAAVLCGSQRAALASRAVVELGADALVLDDGFQHLALARDLDVVVIDAVNPIGNGRLLPRGPNRERFQALSRAQLAWLSRVDEALPDALRSLRASAQAATGRPPVESTHSVTDVLDGALGRSLGADALRGRRVLALCALARPEGFHRTLARLGAQVVAKKSFRDHHAFSDAEIEQVLSTATASGCDAVATTEKDAVRLPPRWVGEPCFRVVRISAQIVAGAEILDALLDRMLASRSPTSTAAAPPEAGQER